MKVVYKRILPVLIGAGLGFAYYYFIGCYNGTCVISSSPYISTVYGGLIGYLFTFPSKKKKEEGADGNN
ncbi:hypothetical protein MNBD_IGNAVI01-1999 [hydrothermal vent metagenome]|uniref:Uncharacterized protein n=1 Tax=hydrothermal vent metagenome TaxID=652676 RepID=A0A3B1C7F8_9ZZZZ